MGQGATFKGNLGEWGLFSNEEADRNGRGCHSNRGFNSPYILCIIYIYICIYIYIYIYYIYISTSVP